MTKPVKLFEVMLEKCSIELGRCLEGWPAQTDVPDLARKYIVSVLKTLEEAARTIEPDDLGDERIGPWTTSSEGILAHTALTMAQAVGVPPNEAWLMITEMHGQLPSIRIANQYGRIAPIDAIVDWLDRNLVQNKGGSASKYRPGGGGRAASHKAADVRKTVVAGTLLIGFVAASGATLETMGKLPDLMVAIDTALASWLGGRLDRAWGGSGIGR